MTSFSFSRRHTIQMFFCWRSRIACLFISPFKSAHTIEAGGAGEVSWEKAMRMANSCSHRTL